MYPGLNADDMVKRGFLSSLMPFRRKSLRPPPPPDQARSVASHPAPTVHEPVRLPPPQVVVHPIVQQEQHLPHFVHSERTQQEIFHEIVNECAQLERSTTTTPFSELSSPTSPHTPLTPCSPSPLMASPMASTLSPPMMYNSIYEPMMSSHHYAPPPYPADESYMQPPPVRYPPIMVTSSDAQLPNTVLIEEVVKMVVSAMRQSTITDSQKESPEEILRRKRNQNNEAAARYRKRQRAARQRAEEELEQLSRRNDDLRTTVDHMEGELQQLKQLVLQNRMA